jgi:hypothetical protein
MHTTSYSRFSTYLIHGGKRIQSRDREAKGAKMSFMKGDLLTRTRKLVKGLAKAEPVWLKAMEQFVSLSLSEFENGSQLCLMDSYG